MVRAYVLVPAGTAPLGECCALTRAGLPLWWKLVSLIPRMSAAARRLAVETRSVLVRCVCGQQ